MTWNAANLTRGTRELSLSHLLAANSIDVAIITEAELPPPMASGFSIEGYTPFLPVVGQGEKTRVLALVKSNLAIRANARIRSDIMSSPAQSVWLELNRQKGCSIVIGGIYRQWSSSASTQVGLPMERDQLNTILQQVHNASQSSKALIVLGDFNLNMHRLGDKDYSRRTLLSSLTDGMEAAGLEYSNTSSTWRSHGLHGGVHLFSCLDHVYTAGVSAKVDVLTDQTTDHRPVIARIAAACGSTNPSLNLSRRNFKAVTRLDLESALLCWPWTNIYDIKDVELAHTFLVDGIMAALDLVAPLKCIKVRRGDNLYLSSDTLNLMAERDRASGAKYKRLRNRVCSMVKRDRLRTNLNLLQKSGNNPRVLWNLACSALGKPESSLPASLTANGSPTVGDAEAAKVMNTFYIEKIKKLRDNLGNALSPPSEWPRASASFDFSFASAGKIAKIVAAMKSTEALGLDDIPVSILKKGVEVLASPIAHLVNRSLASGTVPTGFKTGRVIPVHKGKGKDTAAPSSYRPVSILPALSKVLEAVVKEDLEAHLARVDALPNTQFGFRPGRSSTAAIATAHAKWIRACQEGKIVGVLGFDLSSAFDTVDGAQLLPKLEALGITGTALAWFRSYLNGGSQCVDWNGSRSSFAEVQFGVRQGSILGPILYLVLVADMPDCVGIGEKDNSGYADDTFIWATGDTPESVKALLDKRAEAFSSFCTGNGLVMNAGKTQLMVGGNIKAKDVASFTVIIDNVVVRPGKEMELLGVKFNNKFSTTPHDEHIVKATRKRAAFISRLAHHLPRGEYLRQLARGLVIGKVGYAIAAVAAPRLAGGEAAPSAAYKAIQVAINDVARSVTGLKRTDHVRIPDLLHRAHLPSVNELVISAVAMESWKAFHSSDGGNGERNPVGQSIFPAAPLVDKTKSNSVRSTRSKAAGIVPVPLRGANSFVVHAASLWNESPALRAAPTKRAAKAVARSLAKSAPI